jgi:hypothetical protein
MDVSDQYYAPAYLLLFPVDRKVSGPTAGLNAVEMSKISCSFRVSNPDSCAVQTVSPITAMHTTKAKRFLVTIAAVTGTVSENICVPCWEHRLAELHAFRGAHCCVRNTVQPVPPTTHLGRYKKKKLRGL